MKNILILLLTFVLLTACKTTGLKIGNLDVGGFIEQGANLWNASNISLEQEVQFGENMSAVLLGARSLHPNEKLNKYVNNVGMWLASNSSRADLNWHFGVIDSDAINAFAAPGGYIFITSGMINNMNSEAELAAVLAHEIIHVIESHHLTAIKSGALRGSLTETLFLSVDAYQANTNASQKDREYKAWTKKITGAAQDLYSKGLDRDDEFDADKYGIRLLAKSGYDPFAFVTNLQILESIDPEDSNLALMYKTHPTPSERLDEISEHLAKLENVTGLTAEQRFQRVLSE